MQSFKLPKVVAAWLPLLVSSLHAQVEYVDPTIGGVALMLVPTRPLVHMPNSMIRFYPVRNDQVDLEMRSFPLSIVSHRHGELFSMMPGEREGPQVWDQEITTPYYYSTRFDDSLIRTEFAATERAGYFRCTFPDEKAVLRFGNLFPGELKEVGDRAITGEERFRDMKAYVYGEFSQAVEIMVTAGEKQSLTATTKAGTLEFRYGLSFISVEQAKKNLGKEIPAWNFEAVKDAGKARWNKVLGQIAIKGGTDAQKRVFYTSLYRAYERMVNITEDGQYYSAYDHKVHHDDRPFYIDNGKTFRLTAANNSRDNKYIQSIKLNGKAMDRLWFKHSDLNAGGHLELEMGNTPNRKLGIANPPPSSLTLDPGFFSSNP